MTKFGHRMELKYCGIFSAGFSVRDFQCGISQLSSKSWTDLVADAGGSGKSSSGVLIYTPTDLTFTLS